MTRIKMIHTISTAAEAFLDGKEYDVIDAIARDFIRTKVAVKVKQSAPEKEEKPATAEK